MWKVFVGQANVGGGSKILLDWKNCQPVQSAANDARVCFLSVPNLPRFVNILVGQTNISRSRKFYFRTLGPALFLDLTPFLRRIILIGEAALGEDKTFFQMRRRFLLPTLAHRKSMYCNNNLHSLA